MPPRRHARAARPALRAAGPKVLLRRACASAEPRPGCPGDEKNEPDHALAGTADAPHAEARRPAARRCLSASVDIHPDQLVRRSGHDARLAAHGRRAAARHADADGAAHGDGNAAVRAALAAFRGLARSRAQAARLRDRREPAGPGRGQRATGLVDGLAHDELDVRRGSRDRVRAHRGRQRGADRPDAGGGARAPRRGACEECAGQFRLGGGGPRRGRAAHQARRRAGGPAGGCCRAADVRRDPARHPCPGAARCRHAAALLAGPAHRHAFRQQPAPAGGPGRARGPVAAGAPQRDGGSDPLRDTTARPVRAGRGPVLRGPGPGNRAGERPRPPHQRTPGPRAQPDRGHGASAPRAGCCCPWRRCPPGAWPPLP